MEGFMNRLQRSLLKRLLALFLFVSSILISHPDPAFSLSVNVLGDYDNIAVMEVSGDYAAIDENGRRAANSGCHTIFQITN